MSRAHYKLEDLDRRFQLLRRRMGVLELGAAPGGWTRYVESRVSEGVIVAIDPLPITVSGRVETIEGWFGEPEVDAALRKIVEPASLHLVLSDMAPNISGVRAADQANAMYLADLALEAAREFLQPGGAMVVKLFQGAGFDEWVADARKHFARVTVAKPKASRSESREVYAVCLKHRKA